MQTHVEEMVALARIVRVGERFWHLNTGQMYVLREKMPDGRLRIARPDFSTLVWPDYLLNPSNFERKGPPVVLS
jgi:hypothetical protein